MGYGTDNKTLVLSGGFEVRLFDAMRDYFNFTYQMINCNSDWGVLLPNNTWTGIIGNVHSKVCLICI